METEAIHQQQQKPYLYNWFEVRHWYQPLLCKDPPLARPYNGLIEGLTKRARLPTYIIVILDHSFVDMNKDIEGDQFSRSLINNLDRCIQTRKNALPMKCYNRFDAKFILVKALPLPGWVKKEDRWKYITDRRSLHNDIDKIIRPLKNFVSIDVDFKPEDHYLFCTRHTLTDHGWSRFWSSVNLQMKNIEGKFRQKNSAKRRFFHRKY